MAVACLSRTVVRSDCACHQGPSSQLVLGAKHHEPLLTSGMGRLALAAKAEEMGMASRIARPRNAEVNG